jgi:hypothetical protein
VSFSQTSYVWNGATSTNWNTNTNWTPNGIPSAIDNVTIVTGSNNCLLPANVTINNLTITSGLLNLNSFTLNTTGIVVCNSGSCNNGTFNSTATSLTFAGTSFGANIIATVNDIYFNGSVFNGSVTVTKTSASNIGSTGNNVFNGVTSITNSGTGYLLLTNGGVGRNETFNGLTILNTTNTGGLYIGYGQNVALNANLTINNTSSTGLIQIGRVGSVSLNPGVNITCGTFAGANLNLYKIVQTGSTSQSLSPGSAGAVNIYGSNITGPLTINAGIITAQTSTFAATVNYSVSGTILNNWSSGGNMYNDILTVNNSSSGYIGFANGTSDTYNSDVYANNTSTTGGRIIFGNNCTSQFNGNIYVSQNGTTNASGIALGWAGTFPVINLAAGKNILVNGAFSSGYLQILKMQSAATTAINLTTTGTSNVQLNNNTFNGTVNVTSPDIYPYGGTYNAPVSFVKTVGGTGNHNSSNLNVFNSTLSIENQSNTGYFLLGYQSADQFNDNITVTSSGTGGISFGWSGGTGTPILASGKTISIGAGGYSAGFLQFGSFTQLGTSTPINLTLTGTASFEVYKNSIPTTFNSALTVVAPDLIIRGGTFNNTVEFTKTAGSSNHNNGNQNIFNSTCTINQQSTAGYFMLGYNSNDLFNGDIVVTNTGTQGIYFGWSSGTGTPTQAAGHSITVGGAGFSGGSLNFNTFTQLGNSLVNLNFTGTTTTLLFARNSVFNGGINSVTPSVFFNGCTFNGVVNSTKTGSNNDASSGGNTFNGVSTFLDNGSGYLLFGNGSPDTWNTDVIFTNTGSNWLYACYNSIGNLFNGNITVNSSGNSLGIRFCDAATSTATMSATNTINTGTFNMGSLILPRFTQLGNAPVNLTLASGSNYLQYGPSSSLGGNVTSVSPGLYFHGCTFNGTTDCTKNGSSGDYSQGGNIFNGISNITNSGSSYLLLGNTNPDTWNSDVTFTDNGSERLLPCWATVGNLFNGNIYVNTSGSAQGIQFCGGNATATATLAATKTIAAGTTGLNAGYLQLRQFTQLGNAPINLTLNSTATYLQYGPSSALGGNVTSVSPGLYFHGCTFNGTSTCTKNGATNDNSNGNNIFNGTSIMNNTGSGYLMFGNGNADQFNTTATFNNLGSSHIYVAYNSINNIFGGVTTFNNSPTSTNSWIYIATASTNNSTFNNNIIVNCNNGAGIYFGNSTGTSTLSAGKTLSIGTGGFNAGQLVLKQFTQVSATPQNLTTTGTSLIQYGPTSSFDGNLTSISPGLFFQGCTFNGLATCTKNGTTNDGSIGNNIFNGTSIMNNTGSGYLLFGNGNADQFNTTATFNNLGSSHIYVAYNSINNIFGGVTTFNNSPTSTNSWIYIATASANNSTFNNNIIVNCNNGAGIYFGNSTGTSTLSAGKTLSIGTGGFNAGQLVLKQFTQVSATPQNLTTTGTSLIQYGPTSSFDGDITSVSPGLFFNTSIFNGAVNSIKNGTTNDASPGGNTFNNTANLTNNGTGYLLMANSTSDAYNNHIIFTQNNTGIFYPNHNTNCTYAGNITVNSTSTYTITFGQAGGGIATLTGGSAQTINKTGTIGNPVFTRLIINKSASDVTLNTRANVSTYLTLTQGIVNTTQTNILNMNNASTTTIGNALSFINGPMNYDMALNGSRTLNFPVGKIGPVLSGTATVITTDWRPAILNSAHNNGTSYTYNAELFISSADALGWAMPTTVANVSRIHWWDIARSNTATGVITPTLNLNGNQTITLYYDVNDGVTDPTNLTVCKNTYTATTAWKDIGGSGATMTIGNVTSTSAPTAFNSFSRFTLGNRIGGVNPLPIELLYFTANPINNTVNLDWATATETNNDYYIIEKSIDGINFEFVTKVKANGNGNSLIKQSYHALDETPYNGLSYYRLKQVDKTADFKYANIVSVELKENSYINIYPNPATDKLYINASSNYNNSSIKIISATGVEVKSTEQLISYNGIIDLADLASGMYFIVVNNGLSIQNIKISIQK